VGMGIPTEYRHYWGLADYESDDADTDAENILGLHFLMYANVMRACMGLLAVAFAWLLFVFLSTALG